MLRLCIFIAFSWVLAISAQAEITPEESSTQDMQQEAVIQSAKNLGMQQNLLDAEDFSIRQQVEEERQQIEAEVLAESC